jgi:hypothetical protein
VACGISQDQGTREEGDFLKNTFLQRNLHFSANKMLPISLALCFAVKQVNVIEHSNF